MGFIGFLPYSRKPMPNQHSSAQTPGQRPAPTHVTLAVVLQVRGDSLCVLLWQRARPPFEGAWSLPGGYLEPGLALEESIRNQLARKVDVALDLGDAVPVARLLHGREWREVDALDRQQGAVQAAEPRRNPPIQMFIVERGGRPARPADDSQLFQSGAPFPKHAPTARSGWGL